MLLSLALGCAQTGILDLAPRLELAPPVADFGTVALGETQTYQLALSHVTGSTPQISEVRIDGEAAFVLAATPDTVESFGAVAVMVDYAPTTLGYQTATLSVIYDNPEEPTVTAMLRGRAVTGAAVAWPPLLDFGPLNPGEEATLSLFVDNTGLAPLSVEDLLFSHVSFTSPSRLPTSVAPAERRELEVTFQAADPAAVEAEVTLAIAGASLPSIRLRANNCLGGDPRAYDRDLDGYAVCGGDCDDGDASIHPGVAEVGDGVDQDCDGVSDEGTAWGDDDDDRYAEIEGDCNDDDASVNPGKTEVFGNGKDDDCDGVSDTGADDLDRDGFSTTDCDDLNAGVHPGHTESVDGVDEDCDGVVDDGTTAFDDDGDGATETAGDCDDGNSSVFSGAPEAPDFMDNDCDGTIDEGTVNVDDDGDGASEVGGDCDDADVDVGPGTLEIAGNGKDDDCDGAID